MIKKDNLKRALSLMLVITMILTGYGISTLANTVQVSASSEITANIAEKEKLIEEKDITSLKEVEMPKVVKEIKSERTKNTNTYLLSDGTKKLEIFGTDIRYKENGKWKEYNPEITSVNETDKEKLDEMDVDSDSYIYTNTQGKYKHYFAETVNEENPEL